MTDAGSTRDLTSNDLAGTALDGGKTELSTNIDFEFSRNEINELAQKLTSAQLTVREQALLLAIFTAARGSVGVVPKISLDAAQTSASLREQIINAFIPAGDNADEKFFLQVEAGDSRVTPVPIRPPITPGPTPPKPPGGSPSPAPG